MHAAYFLEKPRSDLSLLVVNSQKAPLRNQGIKGRGLLGLGHFAACWVTRLFPKSEVPQASFVFPLECHVPSAALPAKGDQDLRARVVAAHWCIGRCSLFPMHKRKECLRNREGTVTLLALACG